MLLLHPLFLFLLPGGRVGVVAIVLHDVVHLYRSTLTAFSKLLFCVCHTHCAQSEKLLKGGRQNGLCLTRLC